MVAAVDSKLALDVALAGYKAWRDVGNDLLIVGLVVEVFVGLLSDEHRYKRTVEVIAGVVVLVGVWVEVRNGNRADEVERQIRAQLTSQVATLGMEAAQLRDDAVAREQKLMGSEWLLGNIFLPRRVAVSLGPGPEGKGTAPSGKAFAKLAKLHDTKVAVVAAPDEESCQLAADIAGALEIAHWQLSSPPVTILSLGTAYHLLGVHLVTLDVLPQSPVDKAVQALWEYLSVGYLQDMHMDSSAGIDSDVFRFVTSDRRRPNWWPEGFVASKGAITILVGSKDFGTELGDKSFLDQLPADQRQWFLEHHAPWRE